MNQERLMKVLVGPHVSEKAARIADKYKQITFKVTIDATKAEIKGAVEKLFDVKVKSVNVLKFIGKKRSYGNTLGRRNHWKKAYVILEEGHDISFATGAA